MEYNQKRELKVAKNLEIVSKVTTFKKIDNLKERCVDLWKNISRDLLSFCKMYAEAYALDANYTKKIFNEDTVRWPFGSWSWSRILAIGQEIECKEIFWFQEPPARLICSYLPVEYRNEKLRGVESIMIYNPKFDIGQDLSDPSQCQKFDIPIMKIKKRHVKLLIDVENKRMRTLEEQKAYYLSLPKSEKKNFVHLLPNGKWRIEGDFDESEVHDLWKKIEIDGIKEEENED